mmetsp:Transcript_1968/g.2740  ORF Transcript_1968/g.2740 Transcript_1968/m.2740 type:complete len:438 (+) Transcript_1968:177-1490(+)
MAFNSNMFSIILLALLVIGTRVGGFSIYHLRRYARTAPQSGSGFQMYLDGKNGPVNPQKMTDNIRLGNLEVPSVGIGTISWSSNKLFELENLELQSLVNTACSSNAAFFDTAERYGSNFKTALGMGWGDTESMLNKFIDRSPQTNVRPIVATKFTPTPWRTTVESVVQACEDSCRRLGVEQIDLYQLHMPDIVQPFRMFGQEQNKDEIYWEGLAECYQRGLVKNVGVCNYGPSLLMRCQEKLAQHNVPLASNQIAYSLIGRHDGAQETVDYCNEQGIQVLAFFPFAMGILTGKYNSHLYNGKTIPEDALATLTTSKKTSLEILDLKKYAIGDNEEIPTGGIGPLLTVMEGIAQQRDKTVSQVALNYIICKGAMPIPGARSSAQAMDNIGAMGWRLTNEEVGLLETAADALGIGFDGAGFKRTSEKFVGYGVEKWSLD